jgi:predicted MPP superfamily phosphohydrolase
MVSIVRFALVAAVALVVWVAGLGIVLRWLTARLGRRGQPTGPRSRWRRWTARGVLVLMALSAAVVAWSFVEPYFPRVERVELRSDKITAPVRIVHVSDLHSDEEERAEARVVELVRELDPDVIAFTGDGINSEAGIPVFRETMRALAAIAPVFGVRGNWEAWWFTHVDSFDGSGIEELNGDAVLLRVRGQEIGIGGVAVESEQLIDDAAAAMPADRFRVFLHHYPAAWKLLDGKVDLLLCGDTHGGQIVFPLLGPLVRIARWDDRFYESGLERLGSIWIYVNRGIGMEGGGVPRARFLCPPEVALIELLPAER